MSDPDAPPPDDGRPAERRRATRAPVQMHVEYRVVGDTTVDATRDISEGGLFLACNSPLPLHTRLQVVLPHPAGPLALDGRVVRVVWGGRDRGAPVGAGMAVAFDGLADDDKARLRELMSS